MKFKPNRNQTKLIKIAAVIEAAACYEYANTLHSILLEPGIRMNLLTGFQHMNIALCSDEIRWGDTDVADIGTWSEFCRGVDLNKAECGIFDFYLYNRYDPDRELLGNINVYVIGRAITHIVGYGETPYIWQGDYHPSVADTAHHLLSK